MEEINNIPIKVLMTTDTVGGQWSYSVELCRALKPYGVHFYLVTTGAVMQPYQREEIAALDNITVYETSFQLEWMEAPWKSIDQSGRWLLQLADELQPDLVHLNAYAYGALAWKAPVVMVTHSDVFSWWLAVKQVYPPVAWNEYYKRVNKGLQKANYIVAPSKSILSEVQKIYSVNKASMVIYNSRSAGLFYPALKQRIVCSVGRIWDEAKNIRLLVEAAKNIPYPIRLAGDASFGNGYVQTQGENIMMLGKLPTAGIAAELSVASVYVLPARYEPFGLSVLEAALSGCALVLGKISSLKEIWDDGAIYVDTGNAQALARQVNSLIENEPRRLQYVQKAMERARNYNTATMAAGYMKVYHSLLGSGHLALKTK